MDRQSIIVIVSPLIALMKDQVRQMTERDVSAVYVAEADERTETKICAGPIVLYEPRVFADERNMARYATK